MSKKKHQKQRRALVAPHRVLLELHEADALLLRRKWIEARDYLVNLAHRWPNQPLILGRLANVYAELNDLRAYQRTAEQLMRLTPDDPDLTVGLAGVYLANVRPALALRTFRRFVERWPDHKEAGRARETLALLEAEVGELLAELGLSGEDALELAVLHDEASLRVEEGDPAGGLKVVEELLRRKPDFIPALNNRSQMLALEGRLDQAIATAERVLALHAGNVHALSNLARYLCFTGRIDESRRVVERLRAIESDRPDVWLKQAEVLTYLGDDQGVLEAFEKAKQAGALEPPAADPLFYHLAAVAELRLDRTAEARRHWEQALKIVPGFDFAAANLADLRKPAGERHGPWAFNLENWVPRRIVVDMIDTVERSSKHGKRATDQATQRFLGLHPEITSLLPLLLDRGDPVGREFALRTALLIGTPELLAALRDFALSRRGPDSSRQKAAQAAVEAGLIPAGPVRMWLEGEWREVLLLGFEIHGERVDQHQRHVQAWVEEALEVMQKGEAERAERLLKQALEVEPDAPDLHYNLALAYEIQGRREVAGDLVRQLHERNPDYLFARSWLARRFAERGEIDRAKAMLDPLLSRKRLHLSEFGSLCAAEIEIALAQGQREGARSWLALWERVDPNNPLIETCRNLLNPRGWPSLFGHYR